MGLLLRLTIILAALAACNGGSDAADVGGDDGEPGDAAEAGDLGEGGGEDAPRPIVSGSVTGVLESIEVTTERLCDLDGNGSLDNGIADLGPGPGGIMAGLITSVFASTSLGDARVLAHIPRIRDLEGMNDPEHTLLFFFGIDSDVPPYPEDDLSGEESFFAHPDSVDECGEPLYRYDEGSLVSGESTVSSGVLPASIGDQTIELQVGEIVTLFDPEFSTADAAVCASLAAHDLGMIEPPQLSAELGDLTILEVFLSGGSVFGLPGVSGLSLDVDTDGDGLERFEVDEDARILRCIDGDSTVIEGRLCWQDERIADAFSLTMHMQIVAGNFLGIWPGWQLTSRTPCEGHPPSPGTWAPCDEGSTCERWTSRGCEPGCGGEGEQSCSWRCEGFGPCRPSSEERTAVTSCAQMSLEGGASCAGDPEEASLLDGSVAMSGLRLSEEVTVGRGPLVIEGAVRAARGSGDLPAGAWGIVAYRADASAPWQQSGYVGSGANFARHGYVLAWTYRHYQFGGAPDDGDSAALIALEGDTTAEPNPYDHLIVSSASGLASPPVDADTDGEVVQRMRLAIEPDLPETEEDELLVVATIISNDGMLNGPLLACRQAGCPTRIAAGDVLEVGLVSIAGESDDTIELLDLEGGGFSVETHGLCP